MIYLVGFLAIFLVPVHSGYDSLIGGWRAQAGSG
jgi:hypothetical protein